MSLRHKLQEKAIPLRQLWAARANLPEDRVRFLNEELLFTMPQIRTGDPAIILGATRATAFCVAEAVQQGHKCFVILGDKPVGEENPQFTKLLVESLQNANLPLPLSPSMTEKEYGRYVLREHFGIRDFDIEILDDDHSKNMGANFQALEAAGWDDNGKYPLELYTLAGTARRALMTARKVFGNGMVIAAHNAFLPGIDAGNWHTRPEGRAYLTGEAAKILPNGDAEPLYVRMGYCAPVDIEAERERCLAFIRSQPRSAYRPQPQ